MDKATSGIDVLSFLQSQADGAARPQGTGKHFMLYLNSNCCVRGKFCGVPSTDVREAAFDQLCDFARAKDFQQLPSAGTLHYIVQPVQSMQSMHGAGSNVYVV